MSNLKSVDRLDVHILVDNTTDSLSSIPAHAESEFSYLRRKGMRILSGKCICCANHGLSCLLTAHRGETSHTVLFDTGPEADTFERNTHRLGIDLRVVEGVILSHGHWDHAGGMLRAIDMIRADGSNRDLPYYAHPDMFGTRPATSRWRNHANGGCAEYQRTCCPRRACREHTRTTGLS